LAITVIKVGGSIMRSAELNDWLSTIHSLAAITNIIIVPGGGEFADKVREMQYSLGFDDLTAHRLAILAMTQYGYLLANINQNFHIVEEHELLSKSLNKDIPLLWLPTELLKGTSKISASWDYTSDSIALWLATKLSADRLILVKAKVLEHEKISVEKCIENGTLDTGFQRYMDEYHGEISLINKDYHWKLIDFFK
tara:strand:- start:496 stop:1083 length:588 start_codon:yes stop_codon:yes gene_type:complete